MCHKTAVLKYAVYFVCVHFPVRVLTASVHVPSMHLLDIEGTIYNLPCKVPKEMVRRRVSFKNSYDLLGRP